MQERIIVDLFPTSGLDGWRGNMASVMGQNKSIGPKGVKAVGGSLGDSLWANQRRVEAAHFW